MPNVDSTAVRELIDDVARRPVDRDSGDDMLFRERDAPRRVRRTSRHDVQVLPRPAIDDALTMRVRRQDTNYSAAKLALPFGLLAVLGVLIGLAVTSKSKSEDPAKADAAAASASQSASPTPNASTSKATKPSTPASATTGTKSASTTGAVPSGPTTSSATGATASATGGTASATGGTASATTTSSNTGAATTGATSSSATGAASSSTTSSATGATTSATTATKSATTTPTAVSPSASFAATTAAATTLPSNAAAARKKLIEVRLESTPPGASVTLVDEGNVSVLGRTPIDASVDASKSYEVVFALDAHVTRVEHLDPSKKQSVAVTLDSPKPAKPARKTRHRSGKH